MKNRNLCDNIRSSFVILMKAQKGGSAMGRSQYIDEQFNKKYDVYSNMLYRICMMYLKNPTDVEDAMQDIFIKLLYSASKFKTDDDEKRWLVRVTINVCKDHIKQYWNKKTVPIEAACEISRFPETNELHNLIMKLPEKYRTVIFLHYTEGFSIEEISKICLVGLSAIKMRLVRGREMLKKEMEEQGYE